MIFHRLEVHRRIWQADCLERQFYLGQPIDFEYSVTWDQFYIVQRAVPPRRVYL